MEEQHDWGLDAAVGELRADVRHLTSGLTEVRQEVAGLRQELRSEIAGLRQESRSEAAELRKDIRRLDGRLFQLLVTQVATLATLVGALVATLLS